MRRDSSTVRVRMFVGACAFFAVSSFLAFYSVDRAEAIAAFARTYKTECTTCHTIFPQLNEFGKAFEKNAFVWPHAVPLSKKVKVAQTEEERKSAEFINLSGIPAVLPISFNLGATYTYNDKVEDSFDQKSLSAQILSAGAFGGDRIGFWFNQTLGSYSAGSSTPGSAFFVVRDPLHLPLHVKFGKFSPDLSLWTGTLSGRMLSRGYTAGGFSWTGANAGLELGTFLGPRVFAVVGVNDRNNNTASAGPSTVNANGEVVAGKAATSHSVNDYYGRLAVKFGGTDYHGKEPDVDLDKDSVWDFLSVSLNVFGFRGSTYTGTGDNHDLTRYGVEAEAAYKKVLLMVGWTTGVNDDGEKTELKSTALSTEVDYLFNPMFALALRYDSLDIDKKDKRTVVTPGIVYAPLQSVKFRLSAAIDSNPAGADKGKAEKNTTATLTATLHF